MPDCNCSLVTAIPSPVRAEGKRSALGVLGRLTGLLQSGLLALNGTRVAGEETGLLQGRAVVLFVNRVQCAGNTQAQRTGLAGVTATGDERDDVEATFDVQDGEGILHHLLVHLVRRSEARR